MEDYIYQISASEKTTPSAAIQETKTMLYLMGDLSDSEEIDSFLIDIFNDVTAVNDCDSKLWDAQSKGEKQSSPAEIGKNLVTLYKNYISKIDFSYYILSFKDVSQNNLNKSVTKEKIKILNYSDFTDNAQKTIKKGLIEECKNKSYIKLEDIDSTIIDEFLNKVYFLLNNDDESNYIKKIADVKEEIIKDDILKQIFDEIKGKQMLIKSSSNIEGKKLKTISEVHSFGRTLSIQTINAVVIQRLVGLNLIESNEARLNIPVYFSSIISKMTFNDDEDRINFLQECVNDVYKLFINKNGAKDFWRFINVAIREIKNNFEKDLSTIYDLVFDENNVCFKIAKKLSIIYFLAYIKGGIKSENMQSCNR